MTVDVRQPAEESDPFDEEQEEPGLNRRSASWLLTEEQRVHSIRTLLREDLWGGYLKEKPEHSESFRSEASDSGISLGGDSFRSIKSNVSSGGVGSRRRSTESLDSTIEQPEKQHYLSRKISSSSNGLPNISEHVYTEVNFMRRDQPTHRKQRRSLKKDDSVYVPMDENNNENLTTTTANSKGTNKVFGTLTRQNSSPKDEKRSSISRHFSNSSLKTNEDSTNVVKDSTNVVEPFYDDVTIPLPRKNKTDKYTQCNIAPENVSSSTQTQKSMHSNYVNHKVIAAKYGNYLQDY